jgi:hypothetical protein
MVIDLLTRARKATGRDGTKVSDARRGREDYRNNTKTLFRGKWPAQAPGRKARRTRSAAVTANCAPRTAAGDITRSVSLRSAGRLMPETNRSKLPIHAVHAHSAILHEARNRNARKHPAMPMSARLRRGSTAPTGERSQTRSARSSKRRSSRPWLKGSQGLQIRTAARRRSAPSSRPRPGRAYWSRSCASCLAGEVPPGAKVTGHAQHSNPRGRRRSPCEHHGT